jgi:hypothetical protein
MSLELYKDQRGKIKVKLDTAEDRISAFMIGKIDEDKLHQDDKKMMSRWLKIWNLLINYHSNYQAVQAHVKACAEDPEIGPITIRTAYADLKHATNVWGDALNVSFKAKLVLLSEFAMKTFQIAAQKKDVKEMNRSIAEMREIASKLHAITGLDGFEAATPSTFVLMINASDGNPRTIELDHYEELPEDVAEDIIQAVHNQHLTSDDFMKIVTKSQA